jgi:hypothetical protein
LKVALLTVSKVARFNPELRKCAAKAYKTGLSKKRNICGYQPVSQHQGAVGSAKITSPLGRAGEMLRCWCTEDGAIEFEKLRLIQTAFAKKN